MRNFLFLFLFIPALSPLHAQEDYRRWTPVEGVPIRQGHHIEWQNPSSAVRTEGELVGEVAYVWSDCRNGDRDVYLQVITPEGEFKFEENGIVIVNAPDRQEDPVVLPCDDGGWIIAWIDWHIVEPNWWRGRNDIYCTKIDAQGDRIWGGDEFASSVSIFRSYKENISIIEDGIHGCIITWNDNRAGPSSDIYAMHITNEGHRDERWGENGIPIVAGNGGYHHDVVSDGEGGLIVCWEENGVRDIRAQRVSIEGELLWGGAEGIPVCNQEDAQTRPRFCSDGSGGVFIAWVDHRNLNETGRDIYSQHVDSDGNLLWGDPDGCIPLCTAEDDQEGIQITESGEGSAILVWGEVRHRDEDFEPDITAMKITGEDEMVKLWEPEQGVPIAVAERNLENPLFCNDGQGGAYITWEEWGRDGEDIVVRAQNLNAEGQPVWGEDGLIICDAEDFQFRDASRWRAESINSFGNDGCIIRWADFRTGSPAIYTQIVDNEGQTRFEENGLPVAQGISNSCSYTQLLSKGYGEFVIIWIDNRFGIDSAAPYFQICRNEGDNLAMQQPPAGVPVVPPIHSGMRDLDGMISEDGSVILVWNELSHENGNSIRLQKISGDGVPMWGESGIRCSLSNFDQKYPLLCSDAEGGCIVVWNATNEEDIENVSAQRIDQNGERQWGHRGIRITDYDVNETVEAIIPDGVGGAVFAWRARESIFDTDDDLYIQRISPVGDKLWGEQGRIISNDWNKQRGAVLHRHPDGFVVVWTDGRDDELGTPQYDIFGQLFDLNGDLQWTEWGYMICGAEYDQQYSDLTVDNDGNIWVVWEDDRNNDGRRQKDIYVQKIRNSFNDWRRIPTDLFPEDGLAICRSFGDNARPKIMHDGENGVWVVWQDYSQERHWSNIFATHLRPDGVPHDGWELNGNVVCEGLNNQHSPQISLLNTDEDEGCIIVWEDNRSSGRRQYTNIYVQRLDDNIVSVDEKPRELVSSIYSIDSAHPSPFNSKTVVTFTTPINGLVSFGLYDISGRFMQQILSEWFSAGQYQISIDGENLAAGTYIVKMETGSFISDAKVTLVK